MAKASSQQLLSDLQSKIEERILLPGSILSSENQLCSDYQLSRPTVRRVLDKLCQLRLLEKRPGIGTFVREPTDETLLPFFRIGVDCSFAGGHYYERIWHGVVNSPFGKNCYFHLLNKEKLQDGILDNEVDGIMLCGFDGEMAVLEKLQATEKPIIVINRIISNPSNIAYVTVDHRLEMAAAIEYLLRYGHQKIALIGANHSSKAVSLRCQGWSDAYRTMGLQPPKGLQLSLAELTQPEYYSQRQHFFADVEFSALVCTNAYIYQLFYNEYTRCTGRLLKEQEIIVFDDVSYMVEENGLNCSYIQMPLERLGAVAVEYLRQKQINPQAEPVRQFFPCNLVIRHKQPLYAAGNPE